MSELISVGISDMKYGKSDSTLVTYALGSCIGICMYDKILKCGALGHIMLPLSPSNGQVDNRNKFADTCITDMIAKMNEMGCPKQRIIVKIVGGAKMFDVPDDSKFGNIGARNIVSVKQCLEKANLNLVASDVGLNYGRTVFFHLLDGRVEVRTFCKDTKIL